MNENKLIISPNALNKLVSVEAPNWGNIAKH